MSDPSEQQKLRIAYCTRPNWREGLGGDVIQMLKTKEFIERDRGWRIDILSDPNDPLLQDADLLHLFNTQTAIETRAFLRQAKTLGIPIAVSTIFWDMSHAMFVRSLSQFGIHAVTPSARWFKPFFEKALSLWGLVLSRPKMSSFKLKRAMREIVASADLLLPNSEEELDHLLRYTGEKNDRHEVVFNAVDD